MSSITLWVCGYPGGSNEFDAYTLGGYWTHFGPGGWYVDGVLQGTWYDFTVDPRRRRPTDVDGFGVAASLEAGYPIQLGSGFVLEPQAQLVYQTLDIGNADDGAALIRFRSDDFLTGRFGVRLASTFALDQGVPQRPADHHVASRQRAGTSSWAKPKPSSPRRSASFRSGPNSAAHGANSAPGSAPSSAAQRRSSPTPTTNTRSTATAAPMRERSGCGSTGEP